MDLLRTIGRRSLTKLTLLGLLTLPILSQANQPEYVPLKEQIGDQEEVNLNVYFVGFPKGMKKQLRQSVKQHLKALDIVDAKPWWIPNMPKFGAEEFATFPAPGDLPPELVPPDGLIRYEPTALTPAQDPDTGLFFWQPNRELDEHVDDWHENNDVVYYINHKGSFNDVGWKTGKIKFSFFPKSKLNSLYQELQENATQLVSENPNVALDLYSYNKLMDWLEDRPEFKEPKGGAALVFLNLKAFAGTDYTFYADSQEDLVPLQGVTPSEVQFPPAQAGNPQYQPAADLLTQALDGGLTQAKMLAAVEVECEETTGAENIGGLPGAKPDQSVCIDWRLNPIPNLLGNQGRRFYVADTTRELEKFSNGQMAQEELLDAVTDSAFELYRYGVLQPTIKANDVYSEAYEIRTLVMDLRYDQMDFCVLNELQAGTDPGSIAEICEEASSGFPTEHDYQLEDVFDVDIAKKSMFQFNPAKWDFTFVPLPFGQQPDGSIDPVAATQAKAFLRDFLNEPQLPDPVTGELVRLTHGPLYRDIKLPDGNGGFVDITSSWENGLDAQLAFTIIGNDIDQGGLGIYDLIWPDASVTGVEPFHKSGKANVKPLTLVLTPKPGGPTGENWGAFPINFQIVAAAGAITTFGGGTNWFSVGGNEMGGGVLRRDFAMVTPQYLLGENRAGGSNEPRGVTPDGQVLTLDVLGAATARSLEVGAPHWCNEFDSENATKREMCRSFVKSTTTLQSIETLQHGLGYLHAAEPRKRYHMDGELSSISRMNELIANPDDVAGLTLHAFVNQYTTAGISTVWGQNTSEWNSVGPQTGTQDVLYRSHVREEITAVEELLDYTLAKAPEKGSLESYLLKLAIRKHDLAVKLYKRWDYKEAMAVSWGILSLLDKVLTRLGEPDKIHDPIANILPGAASSPQLHGIDAEQIKDALQNYDIEMYREAIKYSSAH